MQWGIKGVIRFRRHLRIQKTPMIKTQNLYLHPLSSCGQLYSNCSSYLHSTDQIWMIKDVCQILIFQVNEGKVCFIKKGPLGLRCKTLQKRRSDVYAVTRPGRGKGEGKASPSLPRRENFEILLSSNGIS